MLSYIYRETVETLNDHVIANHTMDVTVYELCKNESNMTCVHGK